ncbi:MAG TPA: tail fiber domain-containing protein [Pyrinomonadaceae bacterium]|jgi:hypothetical protein
MRNINDRLGCKLLAFVAVLVWGGAVCAQTTSFTYQGRLTDGGAPANNNYDLQFTLWDAAVGGNQQPQPAPALTKTNVAVTGGVFSVLLDFGVSAFPGADRFLEVGVRPGGSGGAFTMLAPRQQISSTPYALRTLNATAADSLSNACVGCVTDSQINSVAASKLTGTIPASSLPAGGSFIQNNPTSSPQSANFNISGNGTANTLTGNLVNSATQYNIGGNRVLSTAGRDNVFAGVGAGTSNTTGGSNSFFGAGAGANNTEGDSNSFFGLLAGRSNTMGHDNSFFGVQAGRGNTEGAANSFFGVQAGLSNRTGSANSFFGLGAGRNNTTGEGNSFFGTNAGSNNAIGDHNSFFGLSAGFVNSTGFDNSFFGTLAGNKNTKGEANSFFGTSAGSNNTMGFENSFFGWQAGLNNDAGRQNSFFGSGAGKRNGRGTGNTLIGYNADVGSDILHDATAIGAKAVVSTSHTIVLGTSAEKVIAAGTMRVVSIPPANNTQSGHVCFNPQGDLLNCDRSSLRFKTSVRPFLVGLDIVRRLRPINFIWKANGLTDIGLGAEDVAQVAPAFTYTNNKGEVEGVKYERLNILLINAVKEQQQQLEQQRHEIAQLQGQVRQLRVAVHRRRVKR